MLTTWIAKVRQRAVAQNLQDEVMRLTAKMAHQEARRMEEDREVPPPARLKKVLKKRYELETEIS